MDSIQQKQHYLQENIIGRNYDPEEFVDYCHSLNHNVDLESCTLNQLAAIVTHFVTHKGHSHHTPTHRSSDPFDDPFATNTSNVKHSSDFAKLGGDSNAIQVDDAMDFGFFTTAATVAPVVSFIPVAFNPIDLDFLSGSFNPVPVQVTKAQTMQNDLNSLNSLRSTNAPKNQTNIPTTSSHLASRRTHEQPKLDPHSKQQQISQSPRTTQKVDSPDKKSHQQPHRPQTVTQSPAASTVESKESSSIFETIRENIPCRKINPKKVLTTSSPYVVIENHEIISPSMFLPNYVLYVIKVMPLGVEIKRKYKDFEVLRSILGKLFPMTRLPFLNGNNRLSETEEIAIKKQKYMLEGFLNDLLMNTDFVACKVTEEFLTLKDESMFKKKFGEYEKLGEIKSIEDMATFTGTYDLIFTSKHYEFCEKVSPFLSTFEAYQQKVRNLYEQLSSSLQQSTKILMELTETYSGFEQVVQNFNNSTSAIETLASIEATYRSLSELHREWAFSFSQQVKLIDGDIRPGLKFDKENVTSTMKEVFKTRNNLTDSYLKRAEREPCHDKYSSTKLDSFKTELVYPSKNIVVLKYQSAFANSKLVLEVGRLFRDLSSKLQKRYGIMGKLQSNITFNMKSMWDTWASKSP